MRFSRGVASKTAPAPLKWDGHTVVRWKSTLHHAAFGWPFVELSSRAGCDRLSFAIARRPVHRLSVLFSSCPRAWGAMGDGQGFRSCLSRSFHVRMSLAMIGWAAGRLGGVRHGRGRGRRAAASCVRLCRRRAGVQRASEGVRACGRLAVKAEAWWHGQGRRRARAGSVGQGSQQHHARCTTHRA
jgi:hypothetical protein